MATCSSCSADLEPQFKFCIKCGTPVLREWQTVIGSDAPPADQAETIIRVQRSERNADSEVSRSALTLFVWSLGILLVALAVVAGVLILTQR